MMNKPQTSRQVAVAIMKDPAASDWLKRALTELSNRDPLDACQDVAVLAMVYRMRVKELTR